MHEIVLFLFMNMFTINYLRLVVNIIIWLTNLHVGVRITDQQSHHHNIRDYSDKVIISYHIFPY